MKLMFKILCLNFLRSDELLNFDFNISLIFSKYNLGKCRFLVGFLKKVGFLQNKVGF